MSETENVNQTPPAEVPAPSEAAQEGVQAETASPNLEDLLRLAEQKAQENHEAWLRAMAEAENTRRRAAEEIEKARRFALDRFVTELLSVKDSLEAALAVGEGATLESLKSGVELTLKQLVSVLEKTTSRRSTRLASASTPICIRPSPWCRVRASPTPWRACCKKGISCTIGSCGRRW